MRVFFLEASGVIYALALFVLGAVWPVSVGKNASGGALAWLAPAARSRQEVREWCTGVLLVTALALSGFAWPYL